MIEYTAQPPSWIAYVKDRSGNSWPKTIPIPKRLDLRAHSPSGFAWGYHGSGPSQLALAICAHALSIPEPSQEKDTIALAVYQEFKSRVVAKWPMDQGWSISRDDVLAEIEAIIRRRQSELEEIAGRNAKPA